MCDDVSYHQPHGCLLKRLFRRRSKKPSKLRVTGLCEGNSSVTGEIPTQKASNAKKNSIWWRHHESSILPCSTWRFVDNITCYKDKATNCRSGYCYSGQYKLFRGTCTNNIVSIHTLFIKKLLPTAIQNTKTCPLIKYRLLTCAPRRSIVLQFFDMLTPVPYHHFFSSLILLFIYV